MHVRHTRATASNSLAGFDHTHIMTINSITHSSMQSTYIRNDLQQPSTSTIHSTHAETTIRYEVYISQYTTSIMLQGVVCLYILLEDSTTDCACQ